MVQVFCNEYILYGYIGISNKKEPKTIQQNRARYATIEIIAYRLEPRKPRLRDGWPWCLAPPSPRRSAGAKTELDKIWVHRPTSYQIKSNVI